MAAEGAAPALPLGRFTGRESFVQTVRDALACAAHEGWRELVLSDVSFDDWPLGERAVVESLQAWARGGRHLTMLATRFDTMQRGHARFAAWRRTWGHIVECRVCRSHEGANFPSLLWGGGWSLQRIDVARQVIVCEREASRLLVLREWVNEILRHSTPGFPASVLGL